jgi:hypothetical protein
MRYYFLTMLFIHLFILLLVEVDDVSLFGGDHAPIIYNLLFLSPTFIHT